MKILVCIKQVPALEAELEIDPNTKWLADHGPIEYRINHFDTFAIEEALKIKEGYPDASVHVLSVGPARVTDAIRRAMGMGADHGIHLEYPETGLMEPQVIAELISDYACHKAYDLICTGIMAEDDMHSLVGPLLAAKLGMPSAAAVVQTEVLAPLHQIKVKCELEGGGRQTVQLLLPALIAVQSSINQPRYPSLSNLLRAKKQPLERIALADSPPRPTAALLHLGLPPRSSNIRFIEGSLAEKVDQTLQLFKTKGLLI